MSRYIEFEVAGPDFGPKANLIYSIVAEGNSLEEALVNCTFIPFDQHGNEVGICAHIGEAPNSVIEYAEAWLTEVFSQPEEVDHDF